jgi:hypothetical protein
MTVVKMLRSGNCLRTRRKVLAHLDEVILTSVIPKEAANAVLHPDSFGH